MSSFNEEVDGSEDVAHETQLMTLEPIGSKRGRKPKPKRGDSYELYDHADVVEFIRQVEMREELWNSRNEDWHRKEIKIVKFSEVEQECKRFMSYNARAVGKCAQEMWDQLVKDYGIHLNRINKAPSGSGVDDIVSSFPYGTHLQFVSTAKRDRETKIALCFGSTAHTITEKLETPKRKMAIGKFENTPPAKIRRSESLEMSMKEEMEKTRQVFKEIFTDSPSTCGSVNVCKYFEDLTKGMSFIDKLDTESRVISFMSSLKFRGGPEPTIRAATSSPMNDGHPYNIETDPEFMNIKF